MSSGRLKVGKTFFIGFIFVSPKSENIIFCLIPHFIFRSVNLRISIVLVFEINKLISSHRCLVQFYVAYSCFEISCIIIIIIIILSRFLISKILECAIIVKYK